MWIEKNNRLKKGYKFSDFKQAFTFMTEVAELAEQHQHHPNWENTYNWVEIRLTTHDKGDVVTAKDRKLAEAIDAIYLTYLNT